MTELDELTERLQAMSRQSLSQSTRAAQLERLRTELDRPAAVSPPNTDASRRSWLLAAAVAAFLAGSAAVLGAANSALPGDGLYGTKRAMEQVVGLVNSDVAAEHRVAELEALIARRAEPAVIRSSQIRLLETLASLADDHGLRERERQLVLGASSTPSRVDRVVDWDRGASFASSLPDGALVFVDRRMANGSYRYELSITGSWTSTGRSGRWNVSNVGTTDSASRPVTLVIVADADGVSVFIDPDPRVVAQLDRYDENGRAAGSVPGQEATASDAAELFGDQAEASPDSDLGDDPETSAPTTTPAAPSSTTSRPTTTGSPSTTNNSTTSTGSTPSTTDPTTSTTKPTTTTTAKPTTTITRPPTTTTQPPPPTTTTTQPTTTTTRGGDDDDD